MKDLEERAKRRKRKKERLETGRAKEKRKEETKELRKELTGEAGVFIADIGEKVTCLICQKPIKPGQSYRRLPPDAKSPDWRFYHYPDCGPGSEAWYKHRPSRLAQILIAGKEVKREKRLRRRAKKEGKTLEQIKKEVVIMGKKARKGGKGAGLKPMEPVVIPDSVVKKQPKEVQELIRKLNGLKDRSSKEGANIRKALRKAGFKLSDYRTDKPAAAKKEKAGKRTRKEESEED